jgi:hypothetical protein
MPAVGACSHSHDIGALAFEKLSWYWNLNWNMLPDFRTKSNLWCCFRMVGGSAPPPCFEKWGIQAPPHISAPVFLLALVWIFSKVTTCMLEIVIASGFRNERDHTLRIYVTVSCYTHRKLSFRRQQRTSSVSSTKVLPPSMVRCDHWMSFHWPAVAKVFNHF